MARLLIITLAVFSWCWHQTAVRCFIAGMILLAINPALLLLAFIAAVVYMRRPSPETAEDREARQAVDAP